MKVELSDPRLNWQEKQNTIGFTYHSIDGSYWQETYMYVFEEKQIEVLKRATKECHEMMVFTLGELVRKGDIKDFGFRDDFVSKIERSFLLREKEVSIYGRFDFSWDGVTPPKMLEYNADTPTGLVEASNAQSVWKDEVHPASGQFNELNVRLENAWRKLASKDFWHLACAVSEEDAGNLKYMMDRMQAAGLDVDDGSMLLMPHISYDEKSAHFLDALGRPIKKAFKLYPWEWLIADVYGQHIEKSGLIWVEPAYKAALSCKAILPHVWRYFKGHPNLLQASFEVEERLAPKGFVRKPIFSREGANVSLTTQEGENFTALGSYGKEGFILQELALLPKFDGRYTCVGSWVVDGEPAGMGIREDFTPITKDTSLFVPHIVRG